MPASDCCVGADAATPSAGAPALGLPAVAAFLPSITQNTFSQFYPDVVIGTESWLSEEINNAEIFRDDYITFRSDRCSRVGGVYICVKIYIDCRVLWTDEVFEMIAVQVKGINPKFAWEVVGVYRAPN